jgi:hypothetical protein
MYIVMGILKWTLKFLNWRKYKWELSLIDWEFNWIIEIKGEWSYPIKFTFREWVLFDFDEIEDPSWITTLLYGYNPKFWIVLDKKPFNKEMVSDLLDFEKYKNEGSEAIHIMIQHLIWNYDWDNIWYMPEWNGVLTYKNGDCYEWEFKKWIPCWHWKLTFNKYWSMEWEFKDWMLNGEWKSSYQNRWEYEWEFKNWKPNWNWKVVYTNWEIHEWKRQDWKFIW